MHVLSIEERLQSMNRSAYPTLWGWINLASRALQKTSIGQKLFRARFPVKTQIRFCETCSFVGPDMDYSDVDLLKLYTDYRSNTYNTERVFFEPAYQAIQHLVGKSPAELAGRLSNLSQIINQHIDIHKVASVLDWGGGEGKFIPQEFVDKQVTIFDVSTEAVVNKKYIRVSQLDMGATFDYIQVAHVLEHMSHPLRSLEEISMHLKPGGYLYVEVPQDKTEAKIEALCQPQASETHTIHEHLNLFTPKSIQALGKALQLDEVCISSVSINSEWIQARVVCGLFRKTS